MGLLKSVRAAVWGWFPALRPGSMRALSEVTGVVRRRDALQGSSATLAGLFILVLMP